MAKLYMDYNIMEKYPNKYDLTPESIKTLKILDWNRLKKYTWYNKAMEKTGKWWCHLEGCQPKGATYDDFDEFWIGFNEENNQINCNFTCCEGMCSYIFTRFYSETENKYDFQVQANAIKYLNMLIDEGILGLS